ncbi:MAG: orotidine-5'-phosphate decarboxylase [Candidatus Hydrothermarchaeaceae archaeon]
MKKKNGIILALDVSDREKALKVCRETVDFIDAVKVGYPLVLSVGIAFIRKIRKLGKPVIADFKVADIPEISRKICRLATENGADYVVVQGFAGSDVVKACSKVAKIFVVADMSHPGGREFINKESERIAVMAKRYAAGIVAPATYPESIQELRKIVGNLTIISPGVKVQGAEVGSAIRAGADFEIIGRGIYYADNPRKAAMEFSDVIKRG